LTEEDAWEEMQRGPYFGWDEHSDARAIEKMQSEGGYWSSGSNDVSELVHSFGHAPGGGGWRERPEVAAAREASEKAVKDFRASFMPAAAKERVEQAHSEVARLTTLLGMH